MSLIFDILDTIYKKIGFLGVIILLLLSLIAFEYLIIKHDTEKINTLNVKIETQNKSIEEAGKKKTELQNLLDKTADANLELSNQTEELLYKLNHRPLATTCDAAMEEVSESARVNAEEWNAKK